MTEFMWLTMQIFRLILFLYLSKDDISVALTDLNDRIHSLTFCASARPSIQNVNIVEQQNSVPAVKPKYRWYDYQRRTKGQKSKKG